jgi:hypothetical protein
VAEGGRAVGGKWRKGGDPRLWDHTGCGLRHCSGAVALLCGRKSATEPQAVMIWRYVAILHRSAAILPTSRHRIRCVRGAGDCFKRGSGTMLRSSFAQIRSPSVHSSPAYSSSSPTTVGEVAACAARGRWGLAASDTKFRRRCTAPACADLRVRDVAAGGPAPTALEDSGTSPTRCVGEDLPRARARADLRSSPASAGEVAACAARGRWGLSAYVDPLPTVGPFPAVVPLPRARTSACVMWPRAVQPPPPSKTRAPPPRCA